MDESLPPFFDEGHPFAAIHGVGIACFLAMLDCQRSTPPKPVPPVCHDCWDTLLRWYGCDEWLLMVTPPTESWLGETQLPEMMPLARARLRRDSIGLWFPDSGEWIVVARHTGGTPSLTYVSSGGDVPPGAFGAGRVPLAECTTPSTFLPWGLAGGPVYAATGDASHSMGEAWVEREKRLLELALKVLYDEINRLDSVVGLN